MRLCLLQRETLKQASVLCAKNRVEEKICSDEGSKRVILYRQFKDDNKSNKNSV